MNPNDAFNEFKALVESWFERGLDLSSYLWLLCWAMAWASMNDDDPDYRLAWIHSQIDEASKSTTLQVISRIQKRTL